MRIGFYRDDFRKRGHGTLIQFADGMRFPAPELLERVPALHVLNEGATGGVITIPLRFLSSASAPDEEGWLHLYPLPHIFRSPGAYLSERRARQVREKTFYSCLNRYLAENGVDAEVKAGPDIVEAFTLKDYRKFLKEYAFGKAVAVGIYGLVALALTVISPLFILAALPSLLFLYRLLRKISDLARHLELGRGGEYLLSRIKEGRRSSGRRDRTSHGV